MNRQSQEFQKLVSETLTHMGYIVIDIHKSMMGVAVDVPLSTTWEEYPDAFDALHDLIDKSKCEYESEVTDNSTDSDSPQMKRLLRDYLTNEFLNAVRLPMLQNIPAPFKRHVPATSVADWAIRDCEVNTALQYAIWVSDTDESPILRMQVHAVPSSQEDDSYKWQLFLFSTNGPETFHHGPVRLVDLGNQTPADNIQDILMKVVLIGAIESDTPPDDQMAQRTYSVSVAYQGVTEVFVSAHTPREAQSKVYLLAVTDDDDLLNYETVERHYDQTSISEAIPID